MWSFRPALARRAKPKKPDGRSSHPALSARWKSVRRRLRVLGGLGLRGLHTVVAADGDFLAAYLDLDSAFLDFPVADRAFRRSHVSQPFFWIAPGASP